MSEPIGVFVPAFQAERYIGEALESVLAQLPPGSEVVVVDDGSTDGTAAEVERFAPRVRLVRAEHSGIAMTVNRGLAELRAPLIAAIDADDRWLPGKIAAQRSALETDGSIDAVFGMVRQFLSPELVERERFAFSGEPMPGLLRGVMLIRRASLDRVGLMETSLTVGEFVSWYVRAMDAGLRMKMIPELVYERRIHGANTMIREGDAKSDYLRIVKATLDRRRAKAPQAG